MSYRRSEKTVSRGRQISMASSCARSIEGGIATGPGVTEIVWDRKDGSGRVAASGFYLVTSEAGDRTLHRRIFASP